MFPGLLVNFNNGDPGEVIRQDLEHRVMQKWGGTTAAGKVIVSFNDDRDRATTVDPIQQPDLDRMFEFLSKEASSKILIGHRVTSPMIFGASISSGLGNNADELRVASVLFEEMVLSTYRKIFEDTFKKLLGYNGIFTDLYFISLNPYPDFATGDEQPNKMRDGEYLPETTLSEDVPNDISEEDSHEWLEHLEGKGEVINMDEWELVDEEAVSDPYEEFELDDEVIQLELSESRGELKGYANPEKSRQQGLAIKKKELRATIWMSRYAYYPQSNKENSRDFCKSMVSVSKENVVYRKEDIIQMGKSGVNSALAPRGKSNYSIWLFKGGAYCHHYWMRKIYVRKFKGLKVPSIPKWLRYIADFDLSKRRASNEKINIMVREVIDRDDSIGTKFEKDIAFNKIKNHRKWLEDRTKEWTFDMLNKQDLPAGMRDRLYSDFDKDFGLVMNVIEGLARGNNRVIGFPLRKSTTSELENDEEISVREGRKRAIKYPVNDPLVHMKPVNMPHAGRRSGAGAIRRARVADVARHVISPHIRDIKSEINKSVNEAINEWYKNQ